MNSTIIIAVACVMGASILLAIPAMIMSKKRKEKEAQFTAQNSDKAMLHLYCSKTAIDNADISSLNPVTGQQGQKIVALTPGRHSIEGVFETTDIDMGKNVNLKSGKLKFDISLEAGHTYTLAIYLYSPEDRRDYYNGDVGAEVFCLPLDIEGKGESSKAYIICYQES